MDVHTGEVNEDRIIKAMVGRELTDRYPSRKATIGEPIFEVSNWNCYHPLHAERQMIKNVSMNVRKGEVVGNCRPDGRRPHRICHVGFRPRLWPEDFG